MFEVGFNYWAHYCRCSTYFSCSTRFFLLLGNDLASGKVVFDLIVCEKVTSNVTSDDEDDDLYPACAATRALAKGREMEADHSTDAVTKDSFTDINLNDTFSSNIDGYKTTTEPQNIRKWSRINHYLDLSPMMIR